MAAVQQRSPTETLSLTDSSETADSKFIESMEDEVRRCAEHLQRRQSRKGYRSLDRKAINGYSNSSGSYLEDAVDSGARSNSSKNSGFSKMKTLPRSFTLPSEPEERSVLSPRIIAPGRAVTPRKSPAELSKTHVFKFSNNGSGGNGAALPGQLQHYVLEEQDRSPAVAYQKSTSAPPETLPFFSAAGSGSCSRENSVTPLQSPLGRMPIGAVASHSHSRRSSHSSASPPPVPPKRLSASPPPVPPKPSKGRSRRAKSHPPLSTLRSHTPHKVEITSVRNDALRFSSPPPRMDPIVISTEDSDDDGDQPGQLEFPSAEVDLSSFHTKVLKAKFLLGGDDSSAGSEGKESSVDLEHYTQPPPTLRAAPPPSPARVGSAEDKVGGAASGGKGVLSVSSSDSGTAIDPSGSGHRQPVAECTEAQPSPEGQQPHVTPCDVSFEKPADGGNSQEMTSKSDPTLSDLSLGDPSSYPSTSDAYISDPSSMRDSSLSVDEQPPLGSSRGSSEAKVDGGRVRAGESHSVERLGETSRQEEGIEEGGANGGEEEGGSNGGKEERSADDKLPEEAEFLAPSSPTFDSERPAMKQTQTGGEMSGHVQQRESADAEFLADGKSSDDLENVFISPPGSEQPLMIHEAEASGPEIKSIPLQSRVKHGSHGSQHRNRNSKHSQRPKLEGSEISETPVMAVLQPSNQAPSSSSPGKDSDSEAPKVEATLGQQLVSGSTQLEGISESVAIFIKGLQIRLREKEEDFARAQRQHERELKERDEKVKKFVREAKKVEREKWELLKRARDAAERSLHLRTQLDTKEGSLRSVQGALDRTRDELVSVKSANTSLRALLTELRTPRSSADMAVQVELGGGGGGGGRELNGGSLRRNPSIELAFTQGGLSQEELDNSFERTSDNRTSSSSLGLRWPERWEQQRDVISIDSSSLFDESRETTPVAGNYQPLGSRESRKSRKKGAFFSKMRKSSGARRGSKTSLVSTGEHI